MGYEADKIDKIHITFSKDGIKVARSTLNKSDKLSENIIELSAAKVFHKVLNRGRILEIFEKSDYVVLGRLLFKVISVHKQVESFFLSNLKDILMRSSSCRIYLEFEEDTAELSALPWEYLMVEEFENNPAFFIAADRKSQFDFIRFYSNIESRHHDFEADDRKELNIILVLINSTEKPVTANGEHWEEIFIRLVKKNKMDAEGKVSRFNYYLMRNETFADFAQDLKSNLETIDGPYVLHYIGHAEMENDRPRISMSEDEDSLDWIDAQTFADIFDQSNAIKLRLPSLVVMQACESGQLNSECQGLGAALLRKGIPPVVDMQNQVTLDTSLAFVEKLYQGILNGDDIGRAVTRGRYFLGCEFQRPKHKTEYNTNAFGTAVLYISTEKPIRLMPAIKKSAADETAIIKQCAQCGQVYKNYKPDYCGKNSCRGKLLIVNNTVPTEGGGLSQKQANSEMLKQPSFNADTNIAAAGALSPTLADPLSGNYGN